MKKLTCITFSILIFFFGCVLAFAQGLGSPGPNDWWYTFERGKQMFRQGDFGNALLAFEDARRQRLYVYERMERDFIDLLSLPEVRRMGDSLDWVERYIGERHFIGAANALKELYYRIPKESFKNSASAALAALGTLKNYPEAEYWIGETYLVEGELSLALSQFQKAHVQRSLFENPGHATEILYKIADIRRIRQEYNEMERILISILGSDFLWMGNAAEGAEPKDTFAKQAMARTLENEGINRYLVLYRYAHTEGMEAHRLLGYYYYISGRHARAQEHLMFSFLIQNTIIIDEVRRNQYDYTFTSLESLANEIKSSPLLLDFTSRNDYYKTAYYLGASLYGNGKASAAQSIWGFLATQGNAGEWRTRSINQLRSPFVERGAEMP